MSTTVPSPTLGPTGFTAPDEATILAAAQADISTAFGGGLNPGLSTPQGQLASTLAAIIADCNAQFLALASSVDPQYAQGRMQDAIGNIYFMSRFPAQSTTVTGLCRGQVGTVIPGGVPVASDAAGNLYTCPGGTIPAGGQLTLTFSSQATGPIAFTGPLSIYQTTPGWDSITGATLVSLGQLVESAQAFEARRSASVGLNANGSLAAIRAAVLSTSPAPTAAYLVDNPANAPVTIGGLSIPANSIYVAVVGGSAAAVAAAIWQKKDLGCSYAPSAQFTASVAGSVMTVTAVASGILAVGQTVAGPGIPTGTTITSLGTGTGGAGTYNLSAILGTVTSEAMTSATTVYVQDTSYPTPYPTYAVSFTVPVTTPINIAVTVAAASNPPANALALLQDATTGLAMAFTGADGGAPAAGIGATVYGSRYFQTINQILPGVAILSVLVGSGAPTANSQPLNINQFPSIGTITLTLA